MTLGTRMVAWATGYQTEHKHSCNFGLLCEHCSPEHGLKECAVQVDIEVAIAELLSASPWNKGCIRQTLLQRWTYCLLSNFFYSRVRRAQSLSMRMKSLSLGASGLDSDEDQFLMLENAGLCDGGSASIMSKSAPSRAPAPAVMKATASVGICGTPVKSWVLSSVSVVLLSSLLETPSHPYVWIRSWSEGCTSIHILLRHGLRLTFLDFIQMWRI